jgi:Ran GTPase-activating protein (RanGAP) involved in mRNA processing and transport
MTTCRITTLELRSCEMTGQGAERLVEVLAKCPALVRLDLSGQCSARALAGVLGQCTALAHLDLLNNGIGQAGAESLAGVLGQCTALTHLDLSYNVIGVVGKERLRASWRGQDSGLLTRGT